SERELTKQIGHSSDQWPLVILKELVDNAIDAAEEAGIAPAVQIEVADGTITITDNGPGIPAETVAGVLDFSVRVSSREAYASPTRGRAGQRAQDYRRHGLCSRRCPRRDGDRKSAYLARDYVQGRPYPA